MNLFQRLRDALGMADDYDDYYYDDEGDPDVDEAPSSLPGGNSAPRSLPSSLPGNVIGLPGLAMEVVLMQPQSFDEAPEAVIALRERKAVILNLNQLAIEQAQRCADYVAGAVFAIDGHQQQIDDNVFLFTPNFVHITQHHPLQSSPTTASDPRPTPASPWAEPLPRLS